MGEFTPAGCVAPPRAGDRATRSATALWAGMTGFVLCEPRRPVAGSWAKAPSGRPSGRDAMSNLEAWPRNKACGAESRAWCLAERRVDVNGPDRMLHPAGPIGASRKDEAGLWGRKQESSTTCWRPRRDAGHGEAVGPLTTAMAQTAEGEGKKKKGLVMRWSHMQPVGLGAAA